MDTIGVGFAILLSALWTLVFSALCLLASFINERLGHQAHRLWGRGVLWLFGIRLHFSMECPLPTGAAIFAANHQSAFDIPILASLPTDFKWISKAEVRRIPLLGWAMAKMGCFFLTRSNSAQDLNVLKEVEDGLRRGKRVLIFPEGTRSRDGKLLKLKKGAFRLAFNTGVPLYPVAIAGSFAIAAPRRLPTRRGFDVRVRMGAPLAPQQALSPTPGEDLGHFADKYLKELVRLLDEGNAS